MPGLLTLQTDLKSLKYGQDRPNGGSSGQPYIQTDIRTVDATFSGTNLTLYDDGLVRGGMVASQNASFIDTKRITKFLIDPPKGPLFIAKQVGLQLSNPQLERKGDTTERYIGSTRIYNLGINTLAQVPLTALGEHIVRHGILPISDPDTYYESVVTANNLQNDGKENRLVKLLNKFSDEPSETVINQYVGGPGSTYGIGSTLIRRAVTPTDSNYNLLEITNNNAGRALVNDQRQSFSYIDPSTENGIIIRALGQSNARSEQNNTRYIGGIEYSNRGLKSIFADINNDLDAVIQAVDQSVYSNNPTSQSLQNSATYAGKSRVTKDTLKIRSTTDYGVSNNTSSLLANKDFIDLPFKIDPEAPLSFYYTRGDVDKVQLYAGISRETIDTIKVRENSDFEISTLTGSAFAPQDFKLRTATSDFENNPPLYNFIGSNKDTGSHDRKPGLPDIENSNDITELGPSSYPDVDITSLNSRLNLPQLTVNYTNPNIRSYVTLQTEVQKMVTKGIKDSGGKTINNTPTSPTNYKYNTETELLFNRDQSPGSDTNIDNDSLALIFKPIGAFSGAASVIRFLAYITDYTDTFDSTWNDTKYVGRAEKFYIFNEFKRSVSLGFNIPCFTKGELISKHRDLNKLASVLAGEYNSQGLLGGIITQLTVGNYINDQPGIITNLSFNPIDGSSWDLDDKLAFYIKVSFGFTLIHSGLQQYGYKFINV